jgi:uracil-DNA glycosylase family 4
MEIKMYNSIDELTNDCLKCNKCNLCSTRHNVVVGIGPATAEIMFIGEGPGENEDLKGEPFVGRAGILLDKMLAAVDLDRSKNIYITNIVKCRPPENRDPLPEEQSACIDWLRDQFKLIRPKIVVCLGRIAATKIINPDFKVTVDHGKFFSMKGCLFMATYHPAALLRNPNNKPQAFEDFLKLRAKIDEIGCKI